MTEMKAAVKWLFGDPAGHLALCFTMLAVCAVGVALNVPHSYDAAGAVGLIVINRLKG